ncbi:MAG: PfkB family carbohydrate kinase [Planctomycetota bacterium]
MSLVVVGSVGIDTVETPFGKAEDVVGGSAVYFSLAASFFAQVRLTANIGSDFPEAIWDVLRGRGVDLGGLRVFEDEPSFRWSGSYEGDMNVAHTLETRLNVLALPPEPPAEFRGSPFVFLANMGPDVQLSMLDALEGKTVFADTMNLWIETQGGVLHEVLRRVDGLILNDAEARMLTGETSLIRAGDAILEMGPRIVVVKKGEHGAFLFEKSFRFALPAFPTAKVVDPTGAGDSFAGGFVGTLAGADSTAPEALRRAMAYGTVAASLTVEHFSTAGLEAAGKDEIERRFRVLRDFVRI